MNLRMIVNGNDILLKNINHDVEEVNQGLYHRAWSGVYEILESTSPLTNQDINQLMKYGLFGRGRDVNISVCGNKIHYSGRCDYE